MLRRRPFCLSATVVALLSVAGCSSGTTIGPSVAPEGGKPAATIFNDGIAALRAAKTVHLKGPITGIVFDADLGGGNFNGTATQGGATFDIVYLAGPGGDPAKARIYLKGSTAAWTVAQSAGWAACAADIWLSLDPATAGVGASSPQGVAQLTSDAGQLGNLAALADALGGSPGTLSKGTVSTINGTSAVDITSNAGASIFVATDGPPNIVRISGTSNGKTQNLDFTNWNGGASFAAPSKSQALADVLKACPGATAAPSASPSPTP
jgi:hypothetical protein